MLDFLSADGNLAFSTALYVMLGIAVLEGVSVLIFGGISQLIDALMPDFDLGIDVDADLDVDGDAGLHASSSDIASGGIFTQTMAWLRVGQVPILVLFVIWLTAFSLLGFALQSLVGRLGFGFLPGSVAWIPVLAMSLPIVHTIGGWIARLMPKDETSAVSRESFVGRMAKIVLGTARRNEPAQARLRDEHGKTHYVMVEPDVDGDELSSGIPVLLVKVDGPRFRAIAAPSEALVDTEEP